jgi:hypothetical protein
MNQLQYFQTEDGDNNNDNEYNEARHSISKTTECLALEFSNFCTLTLGFWGFVFFSSDIFSLFRTLALIPNS